MSINSSVDRKIEEIDNDKTLARMGCWVGNWRLAADPHRKSCNHHVAPARNPPCGASSSASRFVACHNAVNSRADMGLLK